MSDSTSKDRIEKETVLPASLERVWQAISDSEKFGTWFGMRLNGPFDEGTEVSGTITETAVDDDVAARQRPYVGAPVTLSIVAVEPRSRLAFRWNALPGKECEHITTLVEFTLTETDDGVHLRITESGFDALPPEHRDSAFDGNSEGWALQCMLVDKFLAQETQP